MDTRFGLNFQIVDREFIQKTKMERGYGTNPWSTNNKFIISHRLMIDDRYTNEMKLWLSGFRKGSLLILDEAHHAAPSSSAKYAIDTQFTRSMREISSNFEHRLFLSATP